MQEAIVNKFKRFRDQIFNCFSFRADSTMDLVDALSGNTHATSVVQLSLNPLFRRKYGSIRDAITHFAAEPQQSIRLEHCLIKNCSSITKTQPFRLMVLDCTAAPRKYSKTLEDKGIVHAPNVIPGNKPITVGHQYSIMGFLPEQNLNESQVPWMLLLSTQRVATHTNGIAVGIQQLNTAMPFFGTELTVIVGDIAYSSPKFIDGIQKHQNLVLIARLKGNRIFNHKATPKKLKITGRRERGHELWYGKEFNLKDSITWSIPEESLSTSFKTRKGKLFT